MADLLFLLLELCSWQKIIYSFIHFFNVYIYTFSQFHNLDKPDALSNLCLRPFIFTIIIFPDDKKDESYWKCTNPHKFNSWKQFLLLCRKSLQKILFCSYGEPLPPLHPSNQELAVNMGQNLFVNNPPGADREK